MNKNVGVFQSFLRPYQIAFRNRRFQMTTLGSFPILATWNYGVGQKLLPVKPKWSDTNLVALLNHSLVTTSSTLSLANLSKYGELFRSVLPFTFAYLCWDIAFYCIPKCSWVITVHHLVMMCAMAPIAGGAWSDNLTWILASAFFMESSSLTLVLRTLAKMNEAPELFHLSSLITLPLYILRLPLSLYIFKQLWDLDTEKEPNFEKSHKTLVLGCISFIFLMSAGFLGTKMLPNLNRFLNLQIKK